MPPNHARAAHPSLPAEETQECVSLPKYIAFTLGTMLLICQ